MDDKGDATLYRRTECVLIWDLDGTLVDSLRIKGELFAAVFEDFPEHRHEIIAFHHANGGVPRTEKIKEIAEVLLGLTLSRQEILDRANRFSQLLVNQMAILPLVAGAHQTLQSLSRGYEMYVVTSMPLEEAESILVQHELRHYFVDLYAWPTTKHEAVERIRARHGDSSLFISIGDSQEDAVLAQDLGLNFIQVHLSSSAASCISTTLVLHDLVDADRTIESHIWDLCGTSR